MSGRARRLALACAAVLAGGCYLGPVWAPRVEGRVVDDRTDRPIAGAVVWAYHRHYPIAIHASSWPQGLRTATTDANGRFWIRGALAIDPDPGVTQADPMVGALHPEFGVSFDQEIKLRDRLDVEIRVERERSPLDDRWETRSQRWDPRWACVDDPPCW